MERKNIFDDDSASRRRISYFILLAVCVVIVGIAGFLSYRSIKTAMDKKAQVSDDDTGYTQDMTEQTEKTVEGISKDKEEPEAAVTEAAEEKEDNAAPAVENKSYVMPADGEITVGFSLETPVYSSTLKDWRIHDGIDISAVNGSTVVAVNDGVVESVYRDDLYGVVVEIKHTDGKKSKYAGLEDSVELEEGQMISRGDTVGKIGETTLFELSEGPHLHFEMSENGEKIDPTSVIKQQP